jgi:hypothetical protein
MFENCEYVAATANQLIFRILIQLNRICGRPKPCDGTSIPRYGFMQDESMASYQSMASTDVMAITKWSIWGSQKKPAWGGA